MCIQREVWIDQRISTRVERPNGRKDTSLQIRTHSITHLMTAGIRGRAMCLFEELEEDSPLFEDVLHLTGCTVSILV